MAIRILVVDDHPVTILSLRMLFQEVKDIEVVGEAGSGSEALEKVAALHPDIVLLDSHLPDMPGKEVAEEIIRLGLCTTVLGFSGYDDDAHMMGMIDSGGAGLYLENRKSAASIAGCANRGQWRTLV